jgi:hypothetical protein
LDTKSGDKWRLVVMGAISAVPQILVVKKHHLYCDVVPEKMRTLD